MHVFVCVLRKITNETFYFHFVPFLFSLLERCISKFSVQRDIFPVKGIGWCSCVALGYWGRTAEKGIFSHFSMPMTLVLAWVKMMSVST